MRRLCHASAVRKQIRFETGEGERTGLIKKSQFPKKGIAFLTRSRYNVSVVLGNIYCIGLKGWLDNLF